MRRFLRALIALCALWLSSVSASFALVPNVDIHQLEHTRWTIGDGAPPDIWGLAQGPSGFLWLATGAGLYRFDGVKFERILPLSGESFPSLDMTSLVISPKSNIWPRVDIWIGYFSGGVSELVDGRLKNYPELDGVRVQHVYSLAIDHVGDVWATSTEGLFRFHHGHWERIGQAWNYPYERAAYLHVARDGTVWVTGSTLAYLRPGATKFKSLDISLHKYSPLAEDPAGRIWISDTTLGILPVDEALKRPPSDKNLESSDLVRAKRIMFDSNGVLWGTDADHGDSGGLFRVRSPNGCHHPILQSDVTERFGERDGLTSNHTGQLLEDREGDVWLGTNLGLNRFRANKFTLVQGLPTIAEYGFRLASDREGNVLVSAAGAIYRVSARAPTKILADVHFLIDSLFVDRKKTIWVTARDRTLDDASFIGFLDKNRFRFIPVPPGAEHTEMVIAGEDPDGDLIVSVANTQLRVLKNGSWLSLDALYSVPKLTYTIAFTDSRNRFWIGFFEQTLALLDRGSLHVFTAKDGLAIGQVSALAEVDGRILIGGEQGLAEVDGNSIRSIPASRFPGFSGITGIVRSRDKAIWTTGILGIVRIPEDELQKAFDDPHYKINYRLFDYRDGVVGMAEQALDQPNAVESNDGRLWFNTNHGIISVDPLHLTFNTLPPPVFVTSLTIDGQTRLPENQTLPAGSKEVRIDYTATSLQVPERVPFRYMLEGFSTRWTDPGTLRQAFFTNLPPGQYRFRVIAANNDGVWNQRGASVSFVIPPTFLQSWAFAALCMLAGTAVLWGLYMFRVDQVAGHVRSRLEERIRERERIARELHDTLLQSVQGLILRFHAVVERMQPADPRRQELEHTIERADQVLLEGRERVHHLRVSGNRGDLPTALCEVGEELAEDRIAKFQMSVEGTTRQLHAIVREELIWIGREALINAFTHADASLVFAEISYHWRELRLEIRDDGRGLPKEVAATGGKTGHFGLVGIRERANRIRGRLSLQSRRSSGTALTVIVPANIAYQESHRRWHFGAIRRLFLGDIES